MSLDYNQIQFYFLKLVTLALKAERRLDWPSAKFTHRNSFDHLFIIFYYSIRIMLLHFYTIQFFSSFLENSFFPQNPEKIYLFIANLWNIESNYLK